MKFFTEWGCPKAGYFDSVAGHNCMTLPVNLIENAKGGVYNKKINPIINI
jgi:hypothetical protein